MSLLPRMERGAWLECSVMAHPTERIAIKSADVDKGIVPVVKFLNGFAGVRTLYSCQGGEDGCQGDTGCQGDAAGSSVPYVVFAADDMDALRAVVRSLAYAPCTVEVHWHNDLLPFRFRIAFSGQAHLGRFLHWMGKAAIQP